MRTPNYDTNYKISVCEEYYNRIASGEDITKTKFANEKNVEYTTFLTWMDIYRKHLFDKKSDGAILTSSTPEVTVPKFIEISERTINDDSRPKSQEDTGKEKSAALI